MIFKFVTDTVGLFSTDKVYYGSNVYSAVFHRRIALEKPNSSRVTAKNKPFQRILCDVSSTIRNRFNTTSWDCQSIRCFSSSHSNDFATSNGPNSLSPDAQWMSLQ